MENLIFPINLAVWGYSGLAMILFGLRNVRLYKRSGNHLHLAFARFMIFLGFALAWYSLPGLFFTTSEPAIIATMGIAYTLIIGSMILNTYVLYYLGLLSPNQKRAFLVLQSVLTVIVAIACIFNLEIFYDTWFLSASYGWIISLSFTISFATTLIPTGIFFLRHSFKESDRKRKGKSLAFGVMYIGGTFAALYLVGVLRGAEDFVSTGSAFISFTILLWLALTPVTRETVELTPLQRVDRKKSL